MAIRYDNLSSTVIKSIIDNDHACNGMVLLQLITAVNFAWRLSQADFCRDATEEDDLLNFVVGEDLGLTNVDQLIKDPRQEWQLTKNIGRTVGTITDFITARLATAEPPNYVDDIPLDYLEQTLIHATRLDLFHRFNTEPVLLSGVLSGYSSRPKVLFTDNVATFLESATEKTLYLNECTGRIYKIWNDTTNQFDYVALNDPTPFFVVSNSQFTILPHLDQVPTLKYHTDISPLLPPLTPKGFRKVIYGLLKNGIRLYNGVITPFTTPADNDYFTYAIKGTQGVDDIDVVTPDMRRALGRTIRTWTWTLRPEQYALADAIGFIDNYGTTGDITSEGFGISVTAETESETIVDVAVEGMYMVGQFGEEYPEEHGAVTTGVNIPHADFLQVLDNLDFDFNSTIT